MSVPFHAGVNVYGGGSSTPDAAAAVKSQEGGESNEIEPIGRFALASMIRFKSLATPSAAAVRDWCRSSQVGLSDHSG
jgi:hypothetical protein